MQIGDFVKVTGTLGDEYRRLGICEEQEGRILAVEEDYCLLWVRGLVVKFPKENIVVTLKVEDHIKSVQKYLEKIPCDY